MLRAGQKVRVYGNPSLPLANTHMGGGMGAYISGRFENVYPGFQTFFTY